MPDPVSAPVVLVLWAVLGYLAGSVPFGLIVTRMLGLGDVRAIGSGNIGATNVLRTGSKRAAAATLLLDGLKGAAAVLAARALAAGDAAQLAGLAALVGHCFPVWLGFRGGKGVSTFFGVALALAWPVGLAAALTWAAVAGAFRYASLAGLVATASSPVWALLLGASGTAALFAALAALVLLRHRGNIARLAAGTEPRIGRGR